MCGIAAVVKFDGSPIDRMLLGRMRDTMTHRGPDDAGIHVLGNVGLAHRRLSIVDLSMAGHQPMCNEDGSIWIVCNGEIYNYVELSVLLRQRGHVFRSHTDTEVILHLYEEMGDECVNELNGMFAFALWDSRRARLFAGRDRMGIKPFYYYRDERQFVCASEVKAILQDPAVPRSADPRGIADYLFAGAPLSSKTFFAGIRELPPGHTLVVDDGKAAIRQYWDVRYDYRDSRSAESLVAELADLLNHSVQIQCRSDVPLGTHLSGGLDSSTVAGLASRHVQNLKTFSIRFGEGGYFDETPFAKAVAQALGTQYFEGLARPDQLIELYPSLVWHMDQPPAGGGDGGFSYYSTARLAADHVTVALTGHGGDEIFAGYPAQFSMAFGTVPEEMTSRSPKAAQSAASRIVQVLRREGMTGLARRLAARFNDSTEPTAGDRWIQLHCALAPRSNPLLHRDFLASLAGYAPESEYLRAFDGAPTDRMLDRCLYHDLKVYLPQLLHKEDRASMSVSLESRLPLLDHRIVELLATVTPEHKVPGMVPKALLRRVAGQFLPSAVADRRDKVPFAVPMNDWTNQELRPLIAEVIQSQQCLDRGIFNPDSLKAGHLRPAEILSALNIELWFRLFIDQDSRWLSRIRPLHRVPERALA